jgi:Neocarzinostatin family
MGRQRFRSALVLVLAGIVLAACGGGSGGGDSGTSASAPGAGSSGASAPTGLTGASGSRATASAKRSATRSASSSAAGHAARSSSAARGHSASHGTGSSATHASSAHSTKPPADPCSRSTPGAQSVAVCPGHGLHDGESVHVTGSGFTNSKGKPLKDLIAIQCVDHGTATKSSDCNYPSGITGVATDANGNVTSTVKVHVRFKGNDCSTQRCLIAVTEPVSFSGNPVEATALITFG